MTNISSFFKPLRLRGIYMLKQYFLLVITGMILSAGCVPVPVEEDGEPIGSRDRFLMVNPVGSAISTVKLLTEITYEKVLNRKDTSSVTVGYGVDDRDESDSSALYLLAGGRYYPWGNAPEGFFLHGDIGIARFHYNITDDSDSIFIYGFSLGYKFVIGMFVLELGGGWLNTEFIEDEQEFTPILRVQGGMKF